MNAVTMLLKPLWDAICAIFAMVGQILESLTGPLFGWLRRVLHVSNDEVKRPLLALISVLVIIVSLVSIILSQRQPTPKINLKPFEAVGEVAADETAKMLDGKGTVVVVIMDTVNRKVSALETPILAFKRQLQHHPGVSVIATEAVKPGQIPMMGPEMSLLSADRFIGLLDKYQRADAIVSFVGVPMVREADYARLPKRMPKVLAISTFGMALNTAVDGQIVTTAIMPRFQPPATNTPPTTAREWFDRYYTVVTPGSPAPGPTG